MKIEGDYLFDGPQERVWEVLRDPEMLAQALPGTKHLEQVSESEFLGKMHLRMGAVSGVFSGRVIISEEKPPESCTLTVDGRGASGFAQGTGRVNLTDQGDGTTLMKYEGELQIGGKLAGVGQRLMDSVSKSIIRQGLGALNAAMQVEEKQEKVDEEIPPTTRAQPVQPPSEAEFAATVARDVFKDLTADLFTPENQAILITGLTAIVAMLIGYLLGRLDSKD